MTLVVTLPDGEDELDGEAVGDAVEETERVCDMVTEEVAVSLELLDSDAETVALGDIVADIDGVLETVIDAL